MRSPAWQNVARVIRTAVTSLPMDPVVLEVDLGGLEVFADPLLQKVFYNLVENALHHGERVTHIRFGSAQAPKGITITCQDDGVGIPAGEKEHVFEGTCFKNTGYGMVLSREILAITGITISETSTPGEGARFELGVPPGAFRFR